MAAFDSNEPNRDELLAMAEQAARTDQKQGARMMFRQVLAEDANNERALLWMVKLSASKEERRKWLERVLEVNPENEQARQALEKIAYKSNAARNRLLFRLGAGAYVIVLLLVTLLMLLSISSQPPI